MSAQKKIEQGRSGRWSACILRRSLNNVPVNDRRNEIGELIPSFSALYFARNTNM
jgi:hypothetical protein